MVTILRISRRILQILEQAKVKWRERSFRFIRGSITVLDFCPPPRFFNFLPPPPYFSVFYPSYKIETSGYKIGTRGGGHKAKMVTFPKGEGGNVYNLNFNFNFNLCLYILRQRKVNFVLKGRGVQKLWEGGGAEIQYWENFFVFNFVV